MTSPDAVTVPVVTVAELTFPDTLTPDPKTPLVPVTLFPVIFEPATISANVAMFPVVARLVANKAPPLEKPNVFILTVWVAGNADQFDADPPDPAEMVDPLKRRAPASDTVSVPLLSEVSVRVDAVMFSTIEDSPVRVEKVKELIEANGPVRVENVKESIDPTDAVRVDTEIVSD